MLHGGRLAGNGALTSESFGEQECGVRLDCSALKSQSSSLHSFCSGTLKLDHRTPARINVLHKLGLSHCSGMITLAMLILIHDSVA